MSVSGRWCCGVVLSRFPPQDSIDSISHRNSNEGVIPRMMDGLLNVGNDKQQIDEDGRSHQQEAVDAVQNSAVTR